MDDQPYFPWPRPPSRLATQFAKLFGKKIVSRKGASTVTGYLWRGVFYITAVDGPFEEPPPPKFIVLNELGIITPEALAKLRKKL